MCVNSSIGEELPSTSCSHLTDPPSSQTCNSGPCPPLCHWHPSRWKKVYNCHVLHSSAEISYIPSPHTHTTHTPTHYTHNYTLHTTHTHTQCSNSCGIGVQRMHYRCRYNATDKFANKSCCAALPVPEQVQECVGVLKCTELKWVVTPWEEVRALLTLGHWVK